MQRAEVYLPTGQGKKRVAGETPTPTLVKSRKTKPSLKATSPRKTKDETLEVCFQYEKQF